MRVGAVWNECGVAAMCCERLCLTVRVKAGLRMQRSNRREDDSDRGLRGKGPSSDVEAGAMDKRRLEE
jgi:hypothetical protein